MRPRLLLFDVDGTLISTGGVGRAALERVFDTRPGGPSELKSALDGVNLAGMTDRAIVRAGLNRLHVDPSERAIDELLERYLIELSRVIDERGSVRLQPGIAALLDRLALQPSVGLGLGTGNVEAGARIKLTAAGIFHRFPFGGFGSDAEERADLLRIAAQRGARHCGVAVEDCVIWVIGDTPRDIEAARSIGARSLAVATGPYSIADLESHVPTHVVPTLSPDTVLPILGMER